MDLFWFLFKAIYTSWGTRLDGKYQKPCAYGTIIILVFFSILDSLFDWKNYKDLTHSDYQYSIATGPPDVTSVKFLLTFTIIGTVFCIIEIINTLTLICNGGHTKVDIEMEQMVSMVTCQIPQAAINLSICLCRNNHLTNHQSVSILMSLLNVTLRLYIYGCAKEKVFYIERPGAKKTLKMALYVTATVLWMSMFLTPVFMWDHGRVTKGHFLRQNAQHDLMKGVSISLVRMSTQTQPLTNQNDSYKEMWEEKKMNIKPWLVKNITDIYESKTGITEYYTCSDSMGIFQPTSCHIYNTSVTLKFRFLYYSHKAHAHNSLLGEILYNYAILTNSTNNNNVSTLCEPSDRNLQDNWDLKYYRFHTIHDRWLGSLLIGKRAWEYVCTTPSLKYDSNITVC